MIGLFSFLIHMKILVILQLIGISASGVFLVSLESLSIHIGYLLVVSGASCTYSRRIYHWAVPAGN